MYLKNEKGYTLVITLITLMVLMILGAVYIKVATFETSQSYNYSDSIQAYYLARSGVEATLKSEKFKAREFYLDKNFIETNNEEYSVVKVNVKEIDNEVKITSTGRSGDSEKTISLLLERKVAENTTKLIDNAIFAYNDLSFKNSVEVIGSVESKGSVKGIGEGFTEESQREYISVVSPDDLGESKGNIDIKNGSYEINESGLYGKIESGPDGTLTISSGEEGDKIYIVTENLKMKGDIVIKGKGTVCLFIKSGKDNEIKTAKTQAGSDEAPLLIFLSKEVTLQVKNPGTVFYGYIYGPKATLKLDAHSKINGAVVVKELESDKNFTVHYKKYPILDAILNGLINDNELSSSEEFKILRWE